MMVYITNKAGKTIIVELGSEKFKLNNGDKIEVDCKTEKMRFSCCLNENSTFKYLPLSKSVIFEYNFVLNSEYELTLYNDICEINLVQKRVKGNNLEWYKFIDLQLSNGTIDSKEFFIQDELSAKNQLASAHEKEVKREKRLKVINVLQSVCYIGIPALIILFGIWYFVDLKTALSILIPLIVIGVIVGLAIRRILKKVNKKLDKINSKLENSSSEYTDFNSFFNKSYIYSVVNYKQS